MEDFFSNLHIGEQSKKNNKEIDKEPYKIIESQRYEKIKNSWKKFNINPKNLWLTNLTESTEVWKKSNVEDLEELKSQITDFYQTNTCRKGQNLMHFAALVGNIQIFMEIFDQSIDINPKDDKGETPLHWAAANGHLNVCEFILEHIHMVINLSYRHYLNLSGYCF